jgi:hypothetical protein
VIDPLRLLCDETETFLPGWKMVHSGGGNVALFQSDAGLVAGVAYLDVPKPARATDVSVCLKMILRGRERPVDVGVIYARYGYTVAAGGCVDRRQTRIALLGPQRLGELNHVLQFACSDVDDGSPHAQFVGACQEAIQRSIFGVVPVAADEHGGFTTFSVDPALVTSMRFMAEMECERTRLEVIDSAKRSIIYSIYNFSNKKLADALCGRASNGVDVVCIFAEKFEVQNKRWMESMMASGVKVFLAKSHAKCLVVDGEYVLLGSANASQAEWQGIEFNIEVRSKELAGRLTNLWGVLVPEASSALSHL